MKLDAESQSRSAAIEEQVKRVQQCADPASRAAALDLMRSVLDLHRKALERILEIVSERAGEELIHTLARDSLAGSILLLHDLHPEGLAARVAGALGEIGPALQRYGVRAVVLGSAEGTVRVRLENSAADAPRSHGAGALPGEELQDFVTGVLADAAPDASEIVVEAALRRADFIPLHTLTAAGPVSAAAIDSGASDA
ncbi:MAG: hypothetical protein JO041_10310 [Acidobacteria bacterium]|nr:hypothetical protein [Acidobacteriota bacterium]